MVSDDISRMHPAVPDELKTRLVQDPADIGAVWSLAKLKSKSPEEFCGVGAFLNCLGGSSRAMAIAAAAFRHAATDPAWLEPAAILSGRIAKGRLSRLGWLRIIDVLEEADGERALPSRRLAAALVANMFQHPSEASFERVITTKARSFTIREIMEIVQLGSKFKDDRTLPLARGLIDHYRAATSVSHRGRVAMARLFLYAVLSIRGAGAVIAAEKMMGDPVVSEVFEAEYKGLCLICMGRVAEGIALKDAMPDGLGLLFNGVRLYPHPDTVMSLLRDQTVDPDLAVRSGRPTNIGVFISCDEVYFRAFSAQYLKHFSPPAGIPTEINFLVNGTLSETEQTEAAAISSCPLRFHVDPRLSPDKTFYTLRRFLDLPQHIGDYGLAVVTDIDSLVDLDSDAFKRVAFNNSFGWYDTAVEIPWLRHNCSLAYFSNTRLGAWATQSIAAIAKAIYKPRRDGRTWYCDQVCLAAFWDALGDDIRGHVAHFQPDAAKQILRSYNALSLEAGARMNAKLSSMKETVTQLR